MNKRIIFIFFLMACLMPLAMVAQQTHWTPQGSAYEDNMTLTGVIQINGVEQQSAALEVGAFCGTECRGAVRAVLFPATLRYVVMLTIFGNNGDQITFKLYDHNQGMELNYQSPAAVTFGSNGLGTLMNPYVLNFTSPEYTISASASPSNGGTISGAGTYPSGSTCTLTATPATGYSFVRWTKNGSQVSTNPSYTFTVTENASYVAVFSVNSYTISVSANPSAGGTVSGGGTYNYGSSCTLTATANTGYTFNNWTENGTIVSTSAFYSFEVTGNRALVANFVNASGDGILSGVFSVGANAHVNFSQGNLQYQASTNTWRFATNQYDCIGSDNNNISETYSGWIDLFGWGTSGYNHGANCYQPWSTNTNNSDYYAYGNWEYNLYNQTGQADWGYNAIANGGNTEDQWKSLTNDEWGYVFNTRTTPSGIRYAKAIVNNVNGVILLPDDWDTSYYSLSNTNTNASFSSNTISASQWSNLEQHGAVFLPAASYRYGTSLYPIPMGSYGLYWSASYHDSDCVRLVYFGDSFLSPQSYGSRFYGSSVRLVRSAQNYSFNINVTLNPAEGGTVSGGGTYEEGTTCTLTTTPNEGYVFMNWTESGEVVSTDDTYSFTVTGDRNLVANFENIIVFADPNVKAICVANWDTNGSGELSYAEAAAVTNLGEVFMGNTEITSFEELQFFTGLTSISNNAFYSCSGLVGSLIIPNSVTTIGSDAFYGCNGFTGSLTIPSSVTMIGEYAFYNCSGFTGSLTLPNSVTTIGGRAFYNCSGFTGSLTIPSSVTTIGDGAFYGCSGFTGSLTIPNSVTTLGNLAFYGCSGFTGSLTIGNSVTTIGDGAFYGCSGFTGFLTLPSSVTMIGDYAFYNCNGFSGSLTLPNSVTTIGYAAFYNCSGFTGSLTLPNSVTTLGNFVFNNCSGLTGSLIIPNSVTSIGKYAFCDCDFTGDLIISNSLTSIEEWTFANCNDFTGNLIIPNSVTSIGNYAFSFCQHFTGNLTIPNTVTSIGERAFQYCNSLTGDLVIPNSVTLIGNGAFINCYSLTGDLVIPNSVTSIGNEAFYGCSSLTSMSVLSEIPPTIGSNVFSYVPKSIPVYVPCNSIEAYQNAEGWNEFTNYQCIIHEYVDLGLPSGTLWATCNVGANTPEQYGDYFAWGETQPKDIYNWSTYQYGDGSNFTKYTGSDGLTILLPEDDAATANWGEDWRMPTKEEFEELYNNTTCTWTTQNGVNGRLFTASNGNSLFLPAAGYRDISSLYFAGDYGCYWSSSLYTGYPYDAWELDFGSGDCNMYYLNRYCGQSVRAVRNLFHVTATANPAEGGTIEGTGTYEAGTTCTLTATANAGYVFMNWTENGEVVSTEATYSFTVTGDRDLVANFVEVDVCAITFDLYDSYGDGYTGNYLVASYGDVTEQLTVESGSFASHVLYIPDGSHVELSWIQGNWPEDCSFTISYSNGNWIYHGANLNSGFNYGFDVDCDEMPVISCNINISSNPSDDGTISFNTDFENQQIPFNWTNNATYPWVVTTPEYAGYNGSFCMMSGNGGVHSSTSSIEVTVDFIQDGSISFIAGCWGEGSYCDLCKFFIDDNQQFSYGNLQAWNSYIYEVAAGTHTFRWSYSKDNSVHPTGDAFFVDDVKFTGVGIGSQFNYGQTCTLSATPNEGYRFYCWKENGNMVSTDANYSFTVTADRNLEGVFGPPLSVSVTSNLGTGGMVSGGGVFDYGTTCTVTATPNEGYLFLNWSRNGEVVSCDSNYSFTVTENIDLKAIFMPLHGRLVGTGEATNQYLPSYSYYKYTLSQQIYTPDEIGAAGSILTISYFNTGGTKSRSYDIYMVHTDKNAFESETDWITVTEADRVFSGEVTMTRGYWNTILLDVPFDYDGTSNLAIVVDDNSGNWSVNSMVCRVFNADGNQAIRVYSDNTNYDPMSPPSSYANNNYVALHSVKNQMILGVMPAYHFITAGTWGNAANWSGGALPGAGDAVFIDANCALNRDAEVAMLSVTPGQVLTLRSGKTLSVTGNLFNTAIEGLVVEDGAQLVNTSINVAATVKKNVQAYNNSNPDGWYTISSPMNGMVIEGSNFLTSGYDLYRFNETNLTHDEWENYKVNLADFTTFEKGRGYLYANSNTFAPAFTGILNNLDVTYTLTCTERPNDPLSGFNLIGNPFPHEIYKGAGGAINNVNLASGYYTLTNEGTWEVHSFDDAIQPGQGFLVKATAPTVLTIAKSNEVAFSESGDAKKGVTERMCISVAGDNGQDRTYVYFGQGVGLDKKNDFDAQVPNLWIRDNGHDYAISHVEDTDESLELCFSNRKEGDFTLAITTNDMEFEYLQLIDRVTGVTVDLLKQSVYTFHSERNEGTKRFTLAFKKK